MVKIEGDLWYKVYAILRTRNIQTYDLEKRIPDLIFLMLSKVKTVNYVALKEHSIFPLLFSHFPPFHFLLAWRTATAINGKTILDKMVALLKNVEPKC